MVPEKEKEFDIIVIGAGILGTASSYYLKKNSPGKRILLVDRLPTAAQGNTARSNAMFRNTFTSSDNQILSDRSIDYYLDLEKKGIDIGLRKTGYLWLMSENQLNLGERNASKMLDNGIEIRKYDAGELERFIPELRTKMDGEEARLMKLENIAAAFFGPKCGRLDPDKLANYYLQRFINEGGNVAFNTTAEKLLVLPEEPLGIEGEPFVWQDARISGVRLSGKMSGDFFADSVVIACGAWNNKLLEPVGIDGHVKAKKRQLFKIKASENPRLEGLIHNQHFNELKVLPFVILPKSGCFVKAIAENKQFWIGCDDDLNRPFLNLPDESLDALNAEADYYEHSVHPILKSYLPNFENARPIQMWAGYYSFNTLDYIPYVFKESGLVVVGGDSGSGIMKADSLARIVDAVFRDSDIVELYGGVNYDPKRIGFKSRNVEREDWVI